MLRHRLAAIMFCTCSPFGGFLSAAASEAPRVLRDQCRAAGLSAEDFDVMKVGETRAIHKGHSEAPR